RPIHSTDIISVSTRPPVVAHLSPPHTARNADLGNALSATKPQKADALAQANLEAGGNTDQKLRAHSPFPSADTRNDPSRELKAAETRMKQLEVEAQELMTRMKSKAVVAELAPAPQPATKPDAEARDL